MKAIYSSDTSVDFNGLDGIISQKIELFITTVVRTSNTTIYLFLITSERKSQTKAREKCTHLSMFKLPHRRYICNKLTRWLYVR
jgi:hypothetical protein